MNTTNTAPVIDWDVPNTDLNSIYGDGATRIEKNLPPLTSLAGVGILAYWAVTTDGLAWAWWQYLLAAVLVFDLVGGVVAYGLNSAKRFQHTERIPAERRAAALIRNHVLFSALHLQPILVGWLFPGAGIWWGVLWYVVALCGVVLLTRVPLYLARPVALMAVALTPMVVTVLPNPHGFAWLPAVLVAKLVLGGIREEPYRPA